VLTSDIPLKETKEVPHYGIQLKSIHRGVISELVCPDGEEGLKSCPEKGP